MQGDPKIDILMRPVRAAIERHVKGRAAVTEIYNRAYEAVMNSMDVIDTAKIFCPNCETETECEHAAELYECQECGEDFAKYIVGRNTNPGFYNYADKQSETSVVVNKPSNSDVLMTQDVLTTIKISFNIEDFRPYADKHRNKYVFSGPHWPLVLRYPILFDEYEKLVKINAQETYRLNIEVSRLQSEIARLTAENARLIVEVKESNSLLRSSYQIASREGKETNLEAFKNQIHIALIRQHEIMYPKDENETSNL